MLYTAIEALSTLKERICCTSPHVVAVSLQATACPAMVCWCRFQPTEEENEVYKNYKGKVNELTEVDQFLHEVRTVCVYV